MNALLGAGLLAVALASASLLAWRVRSGRRDARRPVGGGAAAGSPAQPAAAAAAADIAGLRRDWALALVEQAFAAEAAGMPGGDHAVVLASAEQALSRFGPATQRLPRRPQLLPQLLASLNDDASTGGEIAALIVRDPALAANLLKLANSAIYRRPGAPVESVERAVTLIGTQGLRRLVAVALMQPMMQLEGGAFGRLPELVWEHTQYAAVAAAEHARAAEGEDAFVAQLLALLQGLGAIVVVQVLSDECARRGLPAPPSAPVAGLLQRWAPRIAALVAGDWGLPPRSLRAFADQALDDPAAMDGLGRSLLVGAALGVASLEVVRGADRPVA